MVALVRCDRADSLSRCLSALHTRDSSNKPFDFLIILRLELIRKKFERLAFLQDSDLCTASCLNIASFFSLLSLALTAISSISLSRDDSLLHSISDYCTLLCFIIDDQ